MIKEEYSFDRIKDYLLNNIDLLIVGSPTSEERSRFFYDLWKSEKKDILILEKNNDEKINCSYCCNEKYDSPFQYKYNICRGLNHLFSNDINIASKNILVDLSSLDHVTIMVLTKVLITTAKPKSLFASYIRPKKYEISKSELPLSDNIGDVACIPTFVRRETDNQTLCAFIGFEGLRLKNLVESTFNVAKFRPIIAFPSGTIEWYNTTMWNNMDVLKSYSDDMTIHKCLSESIFGTIKLLENVLKDDKNVIIAPLGTRPHSMATAIYASKNNNVRIVYDFVEEKENRSVGIDYINIYHLSSFLND